MYNLVDKPLALNLAHYHAVQICKCGHGEGRLRLLKSFTASPHIAHESAGSEDSLALGKLYGLPPSNSFSHLKSSLEDTDIVTL